MKKPFALLVIFCLTAMLTPFAFATNGTNLIAIGPIARSMGGVGVAQPLDAISAVFSNPAAMCFGEYCPGSEFNFSGTLFMPKVDAKVTNYAGTFEDDSEDNIYPIPAIGFSVPIGSGPSNWRFGLAAYGVSGLGVDYRDTSLNDPTFYDFGAGGQFPMIVGEYTELQIMKFAPSIAFQPNARLSVGAAFHINYASLDLRNGASSGFAFGLQPGIIYKPTDNLSIGLTYTSPQKVTHKNITDFDGGGLDDLDLESPQQVGLGVSYDFFDIGLMVEADVKWLNWSSAAGYEDFDWDDQWVFAIGAQFKATEKLVIRAGYNYAENPVNDHDGWNGAFGPAGPQTINVQGKSVPTYYYETMRIIGFPAVVEQHLTLGMGYQFTDKFSLDLGFMYAFENSISETGYGPSGQPVTIESTLSETSLDFGLTWKF